MKIGLMFLFSDLGNLPQEQVFSELLEEIDYAEELGFDSVWVPEHHYATPGIIGNPLLLATAISQRTSRINIGTAAVVLPFQHPLRVAEDAALIDVLSDGRFMLGVGRGWQVPEFQAFQVDQTASRSMFMESVEIIKKAWTEDKFSHDGEFWSFEDVSVFPRPVQKPHPPLYWTVVTPGSYERAGSMGFPIIRSLNFVSIDTVEAGTKLYEEQLRKDGKRLSDIDLPLTVKIHVAETDEEAVRDAAPNAQWFFDALSQFLPGAPGRPRPSSGYEEYPAAPEKVADQAAADPWSWGACYGSPETVLKSMLAYSDRVFTNHWVTWMRIGELPHEKVMRSMELFAKEVMPGLKAQGQALPVAARRRQSE